MLEVLVALLLGTPVLTHLPGVTVTGSATVNTVLGIHNIIDPKPYTHARFDSGSPEDSLVLLELGPAPVPVRQLGVVANFQEGDQVRFGASEDVAPPAVSRVAPTSIQASDNLGEGPAIGDIDEDPYDATDSSYINAISPTSDTSVTVRFPGQTGLASGTAQVVAFTVRNSTVPATPIGTEVNVTLLQGVDSIALETVKFRTDISQLDQTYAVGFDIGAVTTPTGDIDIRISCSPEGGSAMDIKAISWFKAATFTGQDSGFQSPLLVSSSPDYGQTSPVNNDDRPLLAYHDLGAEYDARFIRAYLRRTRSKDPFDVHLFPVASGASPGAAGVPRAGDHAGWSGFPQAERSMDGTLHYPISHTPRRTLPVEIRFSTEPEADQMMARLWGGGPSEAMVSYRPSSPNSLNTVYGNVLAPSGRPLRRQAVSGKEFIIQFEVESIV